DGTTAGMIACVAAAQPDVVLHIASLFLAQHRPEDVTRLITSNVLFGSQLLEAMSANRCRRILNVATAWQHFGGAEYDPVCLYAATKEAFADILTFYVNAERFSAITLKLHDTYGPGDERPKLIGMLSRADPGSAIEMSAGDQLVDFVHIDDVVDAFVIAARRLSAGAEGADAAVGPGQEESYMISSGAAVPLKELVTRFLAETGKSLRITWGGRPYRAREVMVPWSQGATLPGWSPKVTLDLGLRRLARSHPEQP
nr:NAD-dependent epimerase/dehydratase family protein [Planctomycetota bacterium]